MKEIDENLKGFDFEKDVGLLKDEMNGIVIKEAYFLCIKQYGY